MGLFKKKNAVVVTDSADVEKDAATNRIEPKRTFRQQCCTRENLKEQALLLATVASVIIGIVVGIALRQIKCQTGRRNRDENRQFSSSTSSRRTNRWLPNHAGGHHLHRFSWQNLHQYSQNVDPSADRFEHHFLVGPTGCAILGQDGSSSVGLLLWHHDSRGDHWYHSGFNHPTGNTWWAR